MMSNKTRDEPLILASESPRRTEILGYFSLPFERVPHSFDERSVPWTGDRRGYAEHLSAEKAKNVAHHFPSRIVIAADTIVVIENELLHKPRDRNDAFLMLQQLSGRWHSVVTGLSIATNGDVHTRSEETRVLLQELSDRQINAYLDLNLWADKVGGYAIQRSGSLLVQRIDGCYYNVIGLPVVPLSLLLLDVGIDLWSHVQ